MRIYAKKMSSYRKREMSCDDVCTSCDATMMHRAGSKFSGTRGCLISESLFVEVTEGARVIRF